MPYGIVCSYNWLLLEVTPLKGESPTSSRFVFICGRALKTRPYDVIYCGYVGDDAYIVPFSCHLRAGKPFQGRHPFVLRTFPLSGEYRPYGNI